MATERVVIVGAGHAGFQLGVSLRQGGFDGFGGSPPELTNAYVLWALTEAGAADQLKTELDAQQAAALADTMDPVAAVVRSPLRSVPTQPLEREADRAVHSEEPHQHGGV